MSVPSIAWPQIDTVLLDMDGTLLDLHFDNHFWQHYLPHYWGERRGVTLEEAREDLMARYHARAGTLDWYSVDFWASALEVDIMALKAEIAHLIAVHPGVRDVLAALRQSGRRVALVTNAHEKSLTLKMAHTGLQDAFDIVLSAHHLGLPKEACGFWDRLAAVFPFERARTLLIDDTLTVLDSARAFGMGHLLCVRCPDSQRQAQATGAYPAIDDFRDLLPELHTLSPIRALHRMLD
jgi:HAD superfamily hydrolase (TIGR01509 family)